MAARIAADQAGAVSRRQLYAAGLTRGEVRANLAPAGAFAEQ